jgi:predicted ATPase
MYERRMSRSRACDDAGGFVQHVRIDQNNDTGRFPFTLPVVDHLVNTGGLALGPGVTFLVGDNGTGKSTLVEALAVACGFNAEGGSRSFRFATRATESSLGEHIVLRWGAVKPRTGYFLRAETFYNVATEIERLEREDPGLLPVYGGRSLHERSHGESFLDLAIHRFRPNGLYLLDEPEAALSVQGCLAFVRRVVDLTAQHSQFVIATHSPILLAVPGATILQIDASGGIEPVSYNEAEPVALTRSVLNDPQRFLHHLLEDVD